MNRIGYDEECSTHYAYRDNLNQLVEGIGVNWLRRSGLNFFDILK